MPTEYILTRTDLAPAKINGEQLAELASSNAALSGPDAANKQWFTITLYKTVAGTHVAHVKYRGGSKLREEPVDMVYTGKTAEELMSKIDAIDTDADFVTGWPTETNPEWMRRHETVCDFADRQFREVREKARAILVPFEEPEIIE